MPFLRPTWFDAHLDLAYLAQRDRNMLGELDACGGELSPPAVTLPELARAGVGWCLATIFTEGLPPERYHEAGSPPYAYPLGETLAASEAGRRQLRTYHEWAAAGRISLAPRRGRQSPPPEGRTIVGILMECADPIAHPDAIEHWAEAGVVAIGMAWVNQGRYAGGNACETGLTELGRLLVRRIDALGLVHDLSHLSDRACDELLSCTDATVIASHSNVRALLDDRPQRHLRNQTIREIARRGGMIGLNLYSPFLSGAPRADLEDCRRHLESICEIAGTSDIIGLGSDMDGGFAADRLPRGIDRATHLDRLGEHLLAHGWTDAQVEGFRMGNWLRFWGWGAGL
ncbi:MAG: membrane dipeptidase [Phycisphaeraceae bacterium]|nr:membrane dipeptidase [Phycisphaeraceae bacterium]